MHKDVEKLTTRTWACIIQQSSIWKYSHVVADGMLDFKAFVGAISEPSTSKSVGVATLNLSLGCTRA